MTERERYIFDVMGYLVIEDVLGPDELTEIHSLLDSRDLWNEPGWRNDPNFLAAGEPHGMDEPIRGLIAHPTLVPYLVELCGPKFRYDHGHFILMRRGSENLGLHGGGTPWDPMTYYLVRNGQVQNGLVAVAISLVDAGPEDGGFGCIPGSHKASFPCPREFIQFEETGPIVRVPVRAGSAIIFTEALTHGTWPWQADYERRAIFLKYAPGHLAHSGDYPAPSTEAEYSLLQLRMLAPPSVWDRPDTVESELLEREQAAAAH